MKTRLLNVLAGLLVPVAIPFAALTKPPAALADVPFPVDELVPQMFNKTSVPILLPSRVPFSEQVYFRGQVSSDNYEVGMYHSPDCTATACYIGAIQAERGGQLSTPITEGRMPEFRNIKLFGGTKGIFVNGCGAYCTASVEWQNEGVLYRVTMKNGTQKELEQIANLAIEIGPWSVR
jgi:hypothetical protein